MDNKSNICYPIKVKERSDFLDQVRITLSRTVVGGEVDSWKGQE